MQPVPEDELAGIRAATRIRRRIRIEATLWGIPVLLLAIFGRRDDPSSAWLGFVAAMVVLTVALRIRWRVLARKARMVEDLPARRRASIEEAWAASADRSLPWTSRTTYRARGMRAVPVGFALLMALVWGSTIAKGPEPEPHRWDWVVALGFMAVLAAISLPWCWSGLIVEPEALVLRRPLATRSIAWADVAGAAVSRWGIEVLAADGTTPTGISFGAFRWLGSDGSRLAPVELVSRIERQAVAAVERPTAGDAHGGSEPEPS